MQTAHADCTCSNTHKHAVALSVRLRTAAGPEEVTPPRAERRALADLRREAVVFAQLRSAHTLLHVLSGQTLSVSREVIAHRKSLLAMLQHRRWLRAVGLVAYRLVGGHLLGQLRDDLRLLGRQVHALAGLTARLV